MNAGACSGLTLSLSSRPRPEGRGSVGEGTFTCPLATPEGEVAPTGKKVSLKVAFLAKISPAGLIAEDRSSFDNLAFMKQLGLLK